ncbi:MAG: hypothetical protein AAF098_18970 [Pseudomonadota bacterium]
MKHWIGYAHLLARTMPTVSTEMSLHVLAHRMKRVINIMGSQRHMEDIAA